MNRLQSALRRIDTMCDSSATGIALGCEVSLLMLAAAVCSARFDFFLALEMALAGSKLLMLAVTVALIWDLSAHRTGDHDSAT